VTMNVCKLEILKKNIYILELATKLTQFD